MRASSSFTTLALSCALTVAACDEAEDTQEEDTQEEGTDAEGDSAGGLEGESCDYYCGGVGCNSTCDEGVLYRCEPDNVWHFVEDCGAQGLSCELTPPDDETASHQCV